MATKLGKDLKVGDRIIPWYERVGVIVEIRPLSRHHRTSVPGRCLYYQDGRRVFGLDDNRTRRTL